MLESTATSKMNENRASLRYWRSASNLLELNSGSLYIAQRLLAYKLLVSELYIHVFLVSTGQMQWYQYKRQRTPSVLLLIEKSIEESNIMSHNEVS